MFWLEREGLSSLLGHPLFERRAKRGKEEKKPKKEKNSILELYKKYCGKKKGKAPKEVVEAVALLGWDLNPYCIPKAATAIATAVALGLLFLIPLYVVYLVTFEGIPLSDVFSFLLFELTSGNLLVIFLFLFPIVGFFVTYTALLYYPVSLKDKILKDTLPTLPETFGYLTLSMKLVPNLERALEFAGENGHGKLAEDFKRVVWEVKMGLHSSTEEAVDRLAYKWGKFIPEVKHALMRIRGAVLEPDDARRNVRLDEALKDVILSVKSKVQDLASKMYMPSVQLFYLGVFLPLLLFIVLPVAAAFTDLPVATLPFLVIIYILFIPLLTYAFAKSVLEKRPSLYTPPVPPEDLISDYQSRKRTAMLAGLLVALASFSLFYLVHLNLDITLERAEELYCGYEGCLREKYGYTTWEEALSDPNVQFVINSYDTTPYWLIYGAFFSLSLLLGVYFYTTQKPKVELENKFREMEGEFKDVVYLLASRMGEGKPLEGALDSVAEFMPDSTLVREVFSKIIYNIKVMGLSLRDAIFDEVFGALKDIPSNFLKKAMSILVKAVELGTEMASKALLSYSEQLRYEEEIIQGMKEKMSEIYTMMVAMAVFVGPIVLGITVALQQVISKSLLSVQPPEIPEDLALEMGLNLPSFSVSGKNMATPTEFLVVVFLYNMILTVLLTFYAVKLYEGENKPRLLMEIGKNLVISSILFVLSSWVSTSVVRGMIG